MGVGFSIAMAALMQGGQDEFIEKIVDATPHIVIKDETRHPPRQPARIAYQDAVVSLRGQKPKDHLRGINRGQEIANRVNRRPGMNASAVLRGPVVLRYGSKDVSASIIGIRPDREMPVSKLDDDVRRGDIDALHTVANGIVLGTGLATKLGARLGSTISVSAQSGQVLKMKIVAIFHSGVVSKDEGHIYTLLKKAQVLQDRPNVVNEIRIRLDDVHGARAEALKLERWVGYRSESWDEANEDILEVFVIRNIIMYTVVGAMLVVAAFGIFNIVSTITFEKSRDIAILRSLGFLERDIRVIFTSEGLVIGLGGAVLGSLLGYLLCLALGTIEFEIKWQTEMTRLPLTYSAWHYGIASVIAVGSAAIAGYIPAARASRTEPISIIRGAA